ncbi:beta-glucoside-specific PTS transporter subunit IIABC [Clostridium saccharoperbutylacetonicum]|uniref:beta-glucoside-specific PTS transporter subunit IIABC n=1 Tax=Clostridium saccharoperbutylacetonicum TaxID=36745 RepID=UPI000983B03F|nr:beta-glucoside-specific PTS transporter subunit IIABC [Clostridium saccharoperbutylacetonicum]AQR96720.1 PTS system beta-glucoside-specific EIIBCA component [Clostridium saccharoperbutylacetonicum]NSB32597.1 PTS system beta-glucosides-specific IIC component [Clostridium saccharoperbutylacetonicum]
MNYKNIATEVLAKVGGKANIKDVTHCVTRLRFSLVDAKIVDEVGLKKIDGVMGSINKGGQFQVIIGNEVGNVYNELIKLGDFSKASSNKETSEKQSVGNRIMDVITGSFAPLISAIAGAGMLKVLLTLVTTFNLMSQDGSTFKLLTVMADAVFYFLPFFVAYTSAVKMKTNPFFAMIIAGVLVHPNFIGLSKDGIQYVDFFGIPVRLAVYSNGVVPVLLGVWFMSYVDRFAEKVSPNLIKIFFKPLIVILITLPVVLIVLGPLGTYIGDYFIVAVQFIYAKAGWLGVGISAATYPLLVLTGMHNGMIGVIIMMFATLHFDPILVPSALAANIAQAGAAFAVGLKTKNKNVRGVAFSGTISALVGITEPAMYGIHLKFKKPFYAVLLGGGIAGCLCGILGVKAYAFVNPALISLPIFIGQEPYSFIYTILVAIAAFVIPFVLTLMFGFKDEVEEDNSTEVQVTVSASKEPQNIASPLDGVVKDLFQVNDEVFSQELAGKGVAIVPLRNEVVSPVNGKVSMVFPTKHAIGVTSDKGAELLIHIGIDTVKLEGKFFEALVKVGDEIEIGDVLVKFDKEAIEKEGYDLTTMFVVSNTADYKDVLPTKTGEVKAGEEIIKTI